MKKILFILFLLFGLTLDVNLTSAKNFTSGESVSLESHKIKNRNHMPTETQLLDTLISRGFIDPIAVWRIAIWESGHMKSEVCRSRNNLFGLRTKSYIHFNSWLDCIDYMKRREDSRWAEYSINNSGDYYDFIHWWGYKTGRSRSHEDLEYTKTLKTIEPPESL
jgi:hypothetical protein